MRLFIITLATLVALTTTLVSAGQLVELGQDNFDAHVNTAGRSTLVMFGTDWCTVCQAVHPSFERAGKENKNEEAISIAHVAIDRGNEELADEYDVESFPTILYFDSCGFSGGEGRRRPPTSVYKGTRDTTALLTYMEEKLSSTACA